MRTVHRYNVTYKDMQGREHETWFELSCEGEESESMKAYAAGVARRLPDRAYNLPMTDIEIKETADEQV